ncbi:MAG: TraR/DksA family transcriptional regulator [Alphaproteobacteria bacterium]|nr:TraR/DksA family transcriptional regulator [Alphaproteobacteria bacterium]
MTMPEPVVPEDYDPEKDDTYMNLVMVAYFRNKLKERLAQLNEAYDDSKKLIRDSGAGGRRDTVGDDHTTPEREGEISSVFSKALHDEVVAEAIRRALGLMDEGQYGLCESTGHEIGVRRLQAVPYATLTVSEQEKLEQWGQVHINLSIDDWLALGSPAPTSPLPPNYRPVSASKTGFRPQSLRLNGGSRR